MMNLAWSRALSLVSTTLLAGLTAASAQTASQSCTITGESNHARIVDGADILELEMIDSNILRVHVEPGGTTCTRTLSIDPTLSSAHQDQVHQKSTSDSVQFISPQLRASFSCWTKHLIDQIGLVALLVSGY